MPIYTYSCPKCGIKNEVLQKHSDPAPRCEHDCEVMEKQLSMPSVVKPYGDEGQAKKAIDAILKKEKQTKIYNK